MHQATQEEDKALLRSMLGKKRKETDNIAKSHFLVASMLATRQCEHEMVPLLTKRIRWLVP